MNLEILMDRTEIERHRTAAAAYLKNVHGERAYVTNTEVYEWLLFLTPGRENERGRKLFYDNPFEGINPWAETLGELKPMKRPRRVLLLGNEYSRLQMAKIANRRLIGKICLEHGFQNPRVEFESNIQLFWTSFYGTSNFCGRQAAFLPSIIIILDTMQCYDDFPEVPEPVNVEDRIREIGKFYKIPVKVAELKS